jgi:hypothetical protein
MITSQNVIAPKVRIKIKNLNFLRNFGLNPYHWVETNINSSSNHMTLILQNIEDPSMIIKAILQENTNSVTLNSLSWII